MMGEVAAFAAGDEENEMVKAALLDAHAKIDAVSKHGGSEKERLTNMNR